ncbi:hypothetical protein K458DRAFT_416885 [Lentithecium fluviatile CBS 122367]|uniref:DUF6594 domain-containing protein n=1 Tax=Lentithecium fluviatile CBS 122367 TaxID=1168545 RepID=A0A6G1J551_9PLEO|nr:hypothetical protein K458DRAFT_416885 [Lentithecium fluviatile CBS 122367]
MESPNGAETPQTPPSNGRHTSYSSDVSTVCGSDIEKRDLESQSIKPVDRSLSHYLGLSSPVSANLDDIEEDLAESEDGETADVNALDYQRIDDHPNGYPRLAALLNSDENFLICRKYGLLHNRVLLYRQDELRELELELLSMDKAATNTDDTMLKCRTREERASDDRRHLINRIDEKLKEYNDIVQRTRAFATLQRATERNHKSVWNWIFHSAPLVQEEAKTFDKDRDFVAIVDAKEGSWFDGRVETALSRFGGPFTRQLFISKRDRSSTSDKLVRLYSKRRIDIFSRLIITILAVILLMAPVIALFGTNEKGAIKILIIFLFTMAFSVALSLCTKAKRHEVFAATAAYCAVLVVFLGNL